MSYSKQMFHVLGSKWLTMFLPHATIHSSQGTVGSVPIGRTLCNVLHIIYKCPFFCVHVKLSSRYSLLRLQSKNIFCKHYRGDRSNTHTCMFTHTLNAHMHACTQTYITVYMLTLTLPHFIGYPLILASSTNLHVFATTLCQLTLRPTSLTFLPFTPLPVSFAHLLTTLSSVVHLSVQYPMVKGLSHTPPLLLGTIFLSRSALLIVSLLSDPKLKLTSSVLPTNCLNLSIVICVPQSFISCVVGWVGVFVLLCQCSVTVAMFCNNVSVICNHCNRIYVLLDLGEIACNKYPVLLLLLLLLTRMHAHLDTHAHACPNECTHMHTRTHTHTHAHTHTHTHKLLRSISNAHLYKDTEFE